jgi:glycosyltransferase 2 family protein
LKRIGKIVSIGTFLIAIAINLLTFAIMGHRWYVLTANALQSSYGYQMAVYYKATFLNTFTPANLGGDAYRLIMLENKENIRGKIFRLLLRERLLGLYGYISIFIIAYILIFVIWNDFSLSTDNPYLYGLAASVSIITLSLLLRQVEMLIRIKVRNLLDVEKSSKIEGWLQILVELISIKTVGVPMALTFIGILVWMASFLIVGYGMGIFIPSMQLIAVITLVEMIRLIPITIQGIGLRESTFAYLLSYFGHNLEQCFAIGLIAYLALSISIILCGPIGYVVMWMSNKIDKKSVV